MRSKVNSKTYLQNIRFFELFINVKFHILVKKVIFGHFEGRHEHSAYTEYQCY